MLDYDTTQYTVQPHKVLQVEVPDGKASVPKGWAYWAPEEY